MMTEQQKILNNDEIQNRWKCYIKATSIIVGKCERGFDTLYETLKNVWERIVELVEIVKEALTAIFNDFLPVLRDFEEELYDEGTTKKPRHRPHKHFGTYKINTRGFTTPIMKCARSRC